MQRMICRIIQITPSIDIGSPTNTWNVIHCQVIAKLFIDNFISDLSLLKFFNKFKRPFDILAKKSESNAHWLLGRGTYLTQPRIN